MKNLDLLKAVGQIDEKYIEEADEAQTAQVIELRAAETASTGRTARRAERRRRWVSVAASLAVVVAIGALIATGSLGGFGGAASKNDRLYSRNTAPANNSMPMPEANTAFEESEAPDSDKETLSESKSSLQIQSVSDGVDSMKGLIPEDFSFAITWNCYGVSSYDSKTGILVKEKNASKPGDYTTKYTLSEEEKARIFKLVSIISIDSLDDIDRTENTVVSIPPNTLYLTVRYGGTEKTIGAEDTAWLYISEDKRAGAFLDACATIIGILEETPEWQDLPDFENHYL